MEISANDYKGSDLVKGFDSPKPLSELNFVELHAVEKALFFNLAKSKISKETFEKSIEELDLVKAGKVSQNGKLRPFHIIDKNGKHTVVWKSAEDIEKLKAGKHDHQHHEEVGEGHKVTYKGETHTVHKVKKDGYWTLKDENGKKHDKSPLKLDKVHNPKEGSEPKATTKPKEEKPKLKSSKGGENKGRVKNDTEYDTDKKPVGKKEEPKKASVDLKLKDIDLAKRFKVAKKADEIVTAKFKEEKKSIWNNQDDFRKEVNSHLAKEGMSGMRDMLKELKKGVGINDRTSVGFDVGIRPSDDDRRDYDSKVASAEKHVKHVVNNLQKNPRLITKINEIDKIFQKHGLNTKFNIGNGSLRLSKNIASKSGGVVDLMVYKDTDRGGWGMPGNIQLHYHNGNDDVSFHGLEGLIEKTESKIDSQNLPDNMSMSEMKAFHKGLQEVDNLLNGEDNEVTEAKVGDADFTYESMPSTQSSGGKTFNKIKMGGKPHYEFRGPEIRDQYGDKRPHKDSVLAAEALVKNLKKQGYDVGYSEGEKGWVGVHFDSWKKK